jgi:hypothetical protein
MTELQNRFHIELDVQRARIIEPWSNANRPMHALTGFWVVGRQYGHFGVTSGCRLLLATEFAISRRNFHL